MTQYIVGLGEQGFFATEQDIVDQDKQKRYEARLLLLKASYDRYSADALSIYMLVSSVTSAGIGVVSVINPSLVYLPCIVFFLLQLASLVAAAIFQIQKEQALTEVQEEFQFQA